LRGEIDLTAREAMVRLLRYAVEQQASDLHLIVGVPPIIRVHGELFTVPSDKLNAEQVRALCSSLLNEKQLSEFERNGYLCVGLTHPDWVTSASPFIAIAGTWKQP
jgi:Tfp pilus assembly protein, pilus retraction ATPase PilT